MEAICAGDYKFEPGMSSCLGSMNAHVLLFTDNDWLSCLIQHNIGMACPRLLVTSFDHVSRSIKSNALLLKKH